ncbi:hypothetical protein [Burkholderia stabilis]|uniref:hypothetical protein n=1 Tax=Burkholderia stabilis TaxID=95485 RepID=UPI0015907217|nr:hypothetical protein [Burkholderia stabilis]
MSADSIEPGSISKIVSAGLGGQENASDMAPPPKTAAELEAEAALRDLDAAAGMSTDPGSEGAQAKASTVSEDENPEATRARLMKKAAAQREKGRKSLTTAQSGIAMVQQQIVVKDRVVGSALERCQQQLRSDPLGPLCSTLDLTHLGHQVDAQHVA